jgi:hypothetical protein
VQNIRISATIRLYQCKYRSKTGVPPVDKGMLMCYNMGDLKNPETKNSILEAGELKKYISSLDTYPLELDIAFPLFGWEVLFRGNRFAGLINDLPDSLLQNNRAIQRKGGLSYVLSDTVIDRYSLKKGDMLREEQSDYQEIIRSCQFIEDKIKPADRSIILYHLDSLTLSKFSIHEMEAIFNCFN